MQAGAENGCKMSKLRLRQCLRSNAWVPVKADVFRLVGHDNSEVIQELESILDYAKSGELVELSITGLMTESRILTSSAGNGRDRLKMIGAMTVALKKYTDDTFG